MMWEAAALGAASCWAVSGLISARPAHALGPFAFGLVRQLAVVLMLVPAVALGGGVLAPGMAGRLALSGLVGLWLGDTLLFMALVRLGPRRAGALFALNAPMAALMGRAVLGEQLTARGWAGVALCAVGVAVAVLGRPGRSGGHAFEAVRGRLWVGTALGLGAAAGQAASAMIARPAMAAGSDPFAASMMRLIPSLAVLALMQLAVPRLRAPAGGLSVPVAAQAAAAGAVGMLVGMTLLLAALSQGEVGIVSTLSALSPVLILPALWALTGARPSVLSVLGAVLAVAGTALIFLR